MRFSTCYTAVRFTGFFWARQFFPYARRWAGYAPCAGAGRQLRRLSQHLSEGAWARGYLARWRYPARRTMALGHALLHLVPPHVRAFSPWVWAILRQIRARSYRSSRYKLGLPAAGQRTHSNASTTSRNKDPAAAQLRRERWVYRVWEPRKHAAASAKPRHKLAGGAQKRVAKVTPQQRRRAQAEKRKQRDPWR